MTLLSRLRPVLLVAAIAAAAPIAFGAEPESAQAKPAPAAAPAEFADRLFLGFAQEASLVPSQWWEGQVEYADGSHDIPVDAFLVRGVFAFRPIKQLEVGGRVGFGTTSAGQGRSDGTGATDLDVYGKWVFQDVAQNLNISVGALLTVPTGDDTAGLGFNSFAGQMFGGIRYRFSEFELGGHVGVRYNGDGEFQGFDLDGKGSFEIGATVLFPLANEVSLVGEAQMETDRFEQIDSSTQLLFGVNWRAFGRGMFRGAVAGGLTNGSPDFRVILGYAYSF
jgi:hypothetical protein